MSEIEFIEAVARCAQLLPASCRLPDAIPGATLSHKLEWLIHELKNTLCTEEVKSQFEAISILLGSETDED